MSTLATTVDGLKFANPFVIGSGPPGTNVKVIKRAFHEGWGGVIAKTVSLDSSKVVNVSPRYGKLMANDGKEVIGWVMAVSKIPVWAKMTPNVTHIEEPTAAALRAGCHGVSAINTIRSVMGVNLETLRPEPSVEGYTTPGGYSSKAVKPIALRMVMEIAQLIKKEFPGRTLSGLGGVETGSDAAQFILLGSDTVQVCTGVMKFGYGMARDLCEGLLEFMEGKGFETIDDFKGLSLPYFTTHADLVSRQLARKADEAAARERASMVKSDAEWDGDDFVKQSNALSR
jgi:dihydropyrimidine dehydrogenase (NADP+)/dihydropyrimidine dehydrogenase (NAD+) subunit PreA